jgi:hypothetical protein
VAAFGVVDPVYLAVHAPAAVVQLAVHATVNLLNLTVDPIPTPACFVVVSPIGWGDGEWGEGEWGGAFA